MSPKDRNGYAFTVGHRVAVRFPDERLTGFAGVVREVQEHPEHGHLLVLEELLTFHRRTVPAAWATIQEGVDPSKPSQKLKTHRLLRSANAPAMAPRTRRGR